MSLTTTHDVTVLLIEDEAEIRRFLRTTLPPYGYRLYEATTGPKDWRKRRPAIPTSYCSISASRIWMALR